MQERLRDADTDGGAAAADARARAHRASLDDDEPPLSLLPSPPLSLPSVPSVLDALSLPASRAAAPRMRPRAATRRPAGGAQREAGVDSDDGGDREGPVGLERSMGELPRLLPPKRRARPQHGHGRVAPHRTDRNCTDWFWPHPATAETRFGGPMAHI